MDELIRYFEDVFVAQRSIEFLQILAVLLIISVISYVLTFFLIRNRKTYYVRSVINKALDLACLSVSHGKKYEIRANVFLPTKKNPDVLEIKYLSSNMFDDQDRKIKFQKWQGCVGMAYGYDEPILADLTLPEVERGAKWGLSRRQIELTSEVKSILSIPVHHPSEKGRTIAILNIDSKEPIAAFFETEETQRLASEVAVQIGILLVSFDVV